MYPHSIPRHRDLDLIPGNIPGADGHCWQGCRCFQHGWNMVKQMSRLKLPLASCRWNVSRLIMSCFLVFLGMDYCGLSTFQSHIYFVLKQMPWATRSPRKKENCFEASIWNLEKHLKVGFHFLQKHHNNKDDVRPIDVCECLWWIWDVFLFSIATMAFIGIAM